MPLRRLHAQRLLVSVINEEEATEATLGGAHLIDAEDPVSALGAVSPQRIHAIRAVTPSHLRVTTNIGERQPSRPKAEQAALGVALAGADAIKVGLDGKDYETAIDLVRAIVRTVGQWFPGKQLVPSIFADTLRTGGISAAKAVQLASESGSAAVLIDTLDKSKGLGLLEYMTPQELGAFVEQCHTHNLEAWLAGSLTVDSLPPVWASGADVACVRGAACGDVSNRGGRVQRDLVTTLVCTIPN